MGVVLAQLHLGISTTQCLKSPRPLQEIGTRSNSALTNPNGSTSSFSILDSYHDGAPHGFSKVGFGYGLINNEEAYVYTQSDPCPYQVVATGPTSDDGQYEYILLSNWAKYPVIGLTKSLTTFFTTQQKPSVENELRSHGYTNFFTDALGSVSVMDWSYCKQVAQNQNAATATSAVNISRVNGTVEVTRHSIQRNGRGPLDGWKRATDQKRGEPIRSDSDGIGQTAGTLFETLAN
uniref:Lipocalin domain-containing protein n=1 Tax=Romanomermis culicivorax TaxID=13658 RepID=A0A915KFR8_ROMCU